MALRDVHPIANGLSTDHPIPDLPFVDDSHIETGDPAAIEAAGRRPGGETWGRQDRCRDGGWEAFTTDPLRHDLAWCVRWHPDHGRSVVLYRDRDSGVVHAAWRGTQLLFRSGGYWWDGATWYRPAQVWDAAGEDYYRRPVPAAMTVTAADLLDGSADPARGRVLQVIDINLDAPPAGRWLDDLALWAAQHAGQGLERCVVRVSAPELTGDQLVGVSELAEITGIAASTLRAYIARGEGDVPAPQATVSGRSVWARPVAEEWAEQRERSPESAAAAIATDHRGVKVAPGIAEAWDRFSRIFSAALWDNPERRRALRWRNKDTAQEVAERLAWYVAADVQEGRIIPTDDLAVTIRLAILDEFATGQKLHHATGEASDTFFGITPQVARMLDWLIRHHPRSGRHVIGEIIGEAERNLGVPRGVSEHTLETALHLDGKLNEGSLSDYLDRVLSPRTRGSVAPVIPIRP